MNNIVERGIKTFIEAFFAVFIPQLVMILSNITDYDLGNFKAWGIPILCSCIATAISAAWNAIENKLKKEDGDGNL